MKKPQTSTLRESLFDDFSGDVASIDPNDVAHPQSVSPLTNPNTSEGQQFGLVTATTLFSGSPGVADVGTQRQSLGDGAPVGTVVSASMAQTEGGASVASSASMTNSAVGGETTAPDIAAQAAATPDQSISTAVGGQLAQQMFNVNGSGITIGIISNAFNSTKVNGGTSFQTAVAGGWVDPNAVYTPPQGLDDNNSDHVEGLSMAEIVHEVAPDAHIIFYTADGSGGLVGAINALAADKCNIICDDQDELDEAFYQPGANPKPSADAAITSAVNNGITYFTCAINSGPNAFYESHFNTNTVIQNAQLPSGKATAYNFGTTNNPTPFERIDSTGGSFGVSLQWEQPWESISGGAGSQYTLQWYLYADDKGKPGSVVASGTGDGKKDPVSTAGKLSKGNYFLSIVLADGALPTTEDQFKIIMDNDSTPAVTFKTTTGQVDPNAGVGSGSTWGHNQNPNAITVGAIDYHNTPAFGGTLSMNGFSASGPGEYLFDTSGNLLPSPQMLGKVNLSAPDGGATSLTAPGKGFSGTSAATPAAAAVGALILQANSLFTPQDVGYLLADSSIYMTARPSQSGAGLIQAQLAVGYAVSNAIAMSASQPTINGTHLGDTFVGGAGPHTITANGGFNTLTYGGAQSGVTLTVTSGGNGSTAAGQNGYGDTDSFAGIQQFIGSPNGTNMQATGNSYILHAGGGTGSISDTGNLNQGFSDDSNFQLYFSGTQNQLFGGAGNDWLGVDGNNNALVGGLGNDYIAATGTSNTLAGGSANPTLFAIGTGNVLYAGSGQDWEGVSGNQNQIFGGPGADWMGATGINNAVSAGSGNSTLFANGSSNTLAGSSGNDWVGVSGNNNALYGGAGNDYIAATGSSNILNPNGGGTDILFAAPNAHDHDQFVYHPGYGNVTINNFAPQVGDVINIAGFGITNVQGFAPYVSTSADGSIVLNLSASSHLTLEGITGGLQNSWFNFHV